MCVFWGFEAGSGGTGTREEERGGEDGRLGGEGREDDYEREKAGVNRKGEDREL